MLTQSNQMQITPDGDYSQTGVEWIHRLAKGTNCNDGGAEMIIDDTPSGGAVFSASSITYVSSLTVDDASSKITAGVLKRLLD